MVRRAETLVEHHGTPAQPNDDRWKNQESENLQWGHGRRLRKTRLASKCSATAAENQTKAATATTGMEIEDPPAV